MAVIIGTFPFCLEVVSHMGWSWAKKIGLIYPLSWTMNSQFAGGIIDGVPSKLAMLFAGGYN